MLHLPGTFFNEALLSLHQIDRILNRTALTDELPDRPVILVSR